MEIGGGGGSGGAHLEGPDDDAPPGKECPCGSVVQSSTAAKSSASVLYELVALAAAVTCLAALALVA